MQPDVQQLGKAGDDLWRQMPQGHQRHALLAQRRLIGIRKSGGNVASAFFDVFAFAVVCQWVGDRNHGEYTRKIRV